MIYILTWTIRAKNLFQAIDDETIKMGEGWFTVEQLLKYDVWCLVFHIYSDGTEIPQNNL